ncbi:MAG: CDP-glucose 4,6-dehydratase [Peptostreptococcaceae bacterium]|nr:CDP-glucose 4,6-dehydratase [Peptostreptococcaceae bacterium]
MLEFYKNKKVFITGHTGFKGTWLSRILINAGAEVTGYALESPTEPSLFHLTATEGEMHSFMGDIRDYDRLSKCMDQARPDVVFHLAAQPLVRLSYEQPVETYSTNVMGTVNLLESVRKTPSVRSCVNVTTDKVYENKEWLWGYREDENLSGYDPYSNSKSCSELVTSSYRNSFFSKSDSAAISTARSGNVIGGGDFAQDRIIPDCVRATMANKEIVIRNPNSIRPYQHVLECLSGYLLLAKRQYEDKTYSGAYNFGPLEDDCITTGQLVEMFCSSWEGATWKVQGDGGPHEANFLKLDCSKSKTILKWTPKWSIFEAVDSVVKWYENFGSHEIESKEITDYQITSYFNHE